MKFHQLLFYLLILLLPTQLGKHFWPDWSLVNGLRIDYLSPTIYLTDLLILGILGFWGLEKLLKFKVQSAKFKIKVKNLKLFLIIVFAGGFLLLNALLAVNQPSAFYKLVKLGEFVLLGFYIAQTPFILNTLYLILYTSVIYSSLIAIFQFLKQASLGGIFWWLGERTFNASTPGIAQTIWDGQLILRPYATFPHPNVLAGFLVVALVFLVWQKPKFWWFSVTLGTMALFLTFSRLAWGVWGLSLFAYTIMSPRSLKKLMLLVVLVFILLSRSSDFLPLARSRLGSIVFIQQESIIYRADLNLAAVKMIRSSPLFGVGLGNFLVRLPEFYQGTGQVRFFQPAHNIYLMIGAETGVIGLIGVIGFLILTTRRLLLIPNFKLLISVSAILALGLFDHYFYTLQQGQLLLTLVLGLAWSAKAGSDKI